jgi:hypothetical protein
MSDPETVDYRVGLSGLQLIRCRAITISDFKRSAKDVDNQKSPFVFGFHLRTYVAIIDLSTALCDPDGRLTLFAGSKEERPNEGRR